MAFQAYIAVKGIKQGQFKSETAAEGRKDKWMPLVGFTMEVISPRDPATGLPTGKRQYAPLTIVKEWGAASPQALTAWANNETLTEVDIEFTRPATTASGGTEIVYQTVTLTDAAFGGIDRFTQEVPPTPTAGPKAATDAAHRERWTFTFTTIKVEDKVGKTAFAGNAHATN